MSSDVVAAVEAVLANVTLDGPAHDSVAAGLPAAWNTLDRLGFGGVGVDETKGGSGGSLGDLVAIARCLGRHALETPLIEHATALWCLAESDADPPRNLATTWCPGIDVPIEEGRLAATVSGVPWAEHACDLVVIGRDRVHRIRLADPGVGRLASDDPLGLGRGRLRLDDVHVESLGLSPVAVTSRLGLLWASSLVGAIEATYRLTIEHVTTRVQFGSPLVEIPAVAKTVAVMKCELMQADAALARASRYAVDDRVSDLASPAAIAAIGSARVMASRAATATAKDAHQLHGAIGTTLEHPLSRHVQRLWAWRDAGEYERTWACRVGILADEAGESIVWDQLTS